MRTVPAFILSAAALLQFFSGFASGATCDSVSYSCSALSTLVRDATKDNTICTSATNCDDTDCCTQGTATCTAYGTTCTTPGYIQNPATTSLVCTNDCDDAQCCIQGVTCADHVCTIATEQIKTSPGSITCAGLSCLESECCDPGTDTCGGGYTCQGIGQTLIGANSGTVCTHACDDAQCCEVTSRCEHYACASSTMVLDTTATVVAAACSTAVSTPACDDALCCITTCASGNYACASGTRIDDAECAGNTCTPSACCTSPVSCNVEAYECDAGTHRVGGNLCPGTAQCTQALCCEADLVTTITEARQMKTPRSRQHLTQYGTK